MLIKYDVGGIANVRMENTGINYFVIRLSLYKLYKLDLITYTEKMIHYVYVYVYMIHYNYTISPHNNVVFIYILH